MCSGGGNLLCFLFLISNILPQLEPSTFNRRHRHQFPDHMLHHHLMLLLKQHPDKKKTEEEEKRLGPPPPPPLSQLRIQNGLLPFNPLQVSA